MNKWLFLQPETMINWRKSLVKCLLLVLCLFIISIQPAFAGVKDDNYEGSVFVIYAGNGSLIPPKQTLAHALAEHKPAMLAFYVDDSKDCKEYAIAISQVQAYYGRAAEIIPVSVDSIPPKNSYDPTEPGYYYSGGVPQIVVFDKSGQVVLNKKGQVPFEEIDDRFRQVFDLLPRSESVPLKRRAFNEISSELAK
ncbi:MAG TPA: thylakoid membrane photosystem I accumulation factor [Nostocaceae cyanobacterium]|nr:thylakoid membrane photosystem I accumulation factor [Nostocaceae cyanobacterium]